MKHNKIYIGIILVLMLLCAGLALISHRLYANEQNLLQTYTNEIIPEIVCIGDSLTAGTGGEGISYPDYLEELLWDKSLYIPVRNYGVGGENTVTIAARMGAIPFRMEDFTIPSDTTPVEVHFISEENKLVQPLRQGDAGINPCVIAGVEGRLTIDQTDYKDTSYTYYFTRSEAGNKTVVEKGTPVETYASSARKDGIFIIFMGENHGYNDIDDLISQQQSILALQDKNRDKYLILGLTSGTKAEREELETKMQETYGSKYINLREYMSTKGPYDANIDLTNSDLEQMREGKVPDCLLSDGIHFKPDGYRLIAEQVLERMNQLGYFDDIIDTVEQYGAQK